MAKVQLVKWEGERRYLKARLTEQLREGGDWERGGLGCLSVVRDVVNRLRYVDVEAHAVKAHTQGGVKAPRQEIEGNEGGSGVGAGGAWDMEAGADTD